MQKESSFQHFSFQYVFGFSNENVLRVKWGSFNKSSHKLCQNANFENGGTTIQVSILHVLLNILSISSLPRTHDTSVNFEMLMSSHVILGFEET